MTSTVDTTDVLVRRALDAVGVDLQLRGLGELLLQAAATGDEPLVEAVDRAVCTMPAGSERFVRRLRSVRTLCGPVPVGYPAGGHPVPAAAAPPERMRWLAGRLARWGDAALGADPGVAGVAVPIDAGYAASLLERYRTGRPAGRSHPGACRDLRVPVELTWRTWWWADGPNLGVAPWSMPAERHAVMCGVHAGAHLDHLALLAEEQGPGVAVGLQFGSGVFVAEAVAMTVEYVMGARHPEVRAVVRRGLIERLARLPGLNDWGLAVAPGSAVMAEAVETIDQEFPSLPGLAAAYTIGPLLLAERCFVHPLVPAGLRTALAGAWRDVWPAG
jgi:hypothetical protein